MSRGKPLIVQGDRTVFLEVDHPDFEASRSVLMTFAELEKSQEHVHVYRITPLSLWNAAAAGMSAESILEFLTDFGKYPVPSNLRKEITEFVARYGLLKLVRSGTTLQLYSAEPAALAEVLRMAAVG